jgi:hypothetical protein
MIRRSACCSSSQPIPAPGELRVTVDPTQADAAGTSNKDASAYDGWRSPIQRMSWSNCSDGRGNGAIKMPFLDLIEWNTNPTRITTLLPSHDMTEP